MCKPSAILPGGQQYVSHATTGSTDLKFRCGWHDLAGCDGMQNRKTVVVNLAAESELIHEYSDDDEKDEAPVNRNSKTDKYSPQKKSAVLG